MGIPPITNKQEKVQTSQKLLLLFGSLVLMLLLAEGTLPLPPVSSASAHLCWGIQQSSKGLPGFRSIAGLENASAP